MDSEVVVRKVEDSLEVTYLAGPSLAEDLGIDHGTLCAWKTSGIVRHCAIRGKHYYAVADATIVLYESPAQTLGRTGKHRTPRKYLQATERWNRKVEKRLAPSATRKGEIWEVTEIERVKEMYLDGDCEEKIAERLGRTYSGVLRTVCSLRREGELPPMSKKDVDAALMRIGKYLTVEEIELVMDAMLGRTAVAA